MLWMNDIMYPISIVASIGDRLTMPVAYRGLNEHCGMAKERTLRQQGFDTKTLATKFRIHRLYVYKIINKTARV